MPAALAWTAAPPSRDISCPCVNRWLACAGRVKTLQKKMTNVQILQQSVLLKYAARPRASSSRAHSAQYGLRRPPSLPPWA